MHLRFIWVLFILIGCSAPYDEPEPIPEQDAGTEEAQPIPHFPREEPPVINKCNGYPTKIGDIVVILPVHCRDFLPAEQWTDPPPIK